MKTSESINELATALAAAQAEMPEVKKLKQGTVRGTNKAGASYNYSYAYADIADVLKTALPVLSKHGLSIVQPTVFADDIVIVRTRLMHSSGQWLESDYPVCSLTGDHQKMGAALTYARRYALSSFIGVAADEDKDGEAAEQVAAPAKKPNGGKVHAAGVRVPGFSHTGEPTLAQRAKDDFVGYMMLVEKEYERCPTMDDLDDAAAKYHSQAVLDAVPDEFETLVAAYKRAERRISGER